jgi:chromosomal replication initiator protein
VAHHSLSGRPIDSALAQAVLGASPRSRSCEISLPRIQEAVATYYDLTVPELISTGRTARITWPRHLAIHLARELTGASLQTIGGAFGGRNHATVLHAAKRAAQRLADSTEARNDLRQLTTMLSPGQDDRTP